MMLAKLGRFWQFAAVALASHVATRHAMIWGHSEGESDSRVASSWIRLLIGVFVAVILFWTEFIWRVEQKNSDRQQAVKP
jgi:hypothetical protein